MLLRCGLALLIALALLLGTTPPRVALAPVADAADLAAGQIPDVYIHMPPGGAAAGGSPLQVLVALHGLGGNGEQFASSFLAEADRNHWLVVAPTIRYGDWTDPDQVAGEDPRLIRWLDEFLDNLPAAIQAPTRSRVLLIGHSRGAQLAHRFALFEPRRVLAVAALAAGTYTLPVDRTPSGTMLRFPFGTGDMKAVAGHPFNRTQLIEETEFWLGVGSEDTNPGDLPRAWDGYLGTTRVQRARAMQDALHALGAKSVLVAFRGAQHSLSPEMANSACSFLRAASLARAGAVEPAGSPAPVRVAGRKRF